MAVPLLFGCLPVAWANIPFAEDLFPELGILLQMASRDGTEIQLNDLKIDEQAGSLEVTRGQRRPQVRAYARLAGAYEMREDIDDRARGSVNASLTMSQPIYHWGSLERRETVAEERLALEGIEATRHGARHFMEIRRFYLQWLLNCEQREILEQSIALAESFVDVRRQLVEVGQSSEQDVLEMEAQLLENRESLSYIQNQINALEGALVRLVGTGLDVSALETHSLTVIEPMSPGALDEMEANILTKLDEMASPEVRRFSIMEGIESEQLAILEKAHHPKLDFVAGIYSDHLDQLNNEDIVLRVQYYAGLQVNWSIFDGWQTDGYRRSTMARKRAYALQERAAQSGVRLRAESLLADLRLNLKQIEARSKRADILNRRQSLVREQVERGLLPGAERIEVEIDYLNVRQRLMEARVNYLLTLMELGLLAGQDPAVIFYQPGS